MVHGERLNAVSHLVGLALAVLGAPALIARALDAGSALKVAAVCVFVTTLVLLYAASSLYHCASGPRKENWARVDHCAIYLLIAGTYTPFTLITLHGWTGWGLLILEWGLAFVGICKELRWGRDTVPSVPLYVFMGWAGVVAASSLVNGLQDGGWMWLLCGGLFYTVGVAFYALDGRLKHAHGIWHVFVLGGSASHFFTVWRFVV